MSDQIKVNKGAWDALAQEHKDAINDIVASSFGNVAIVGDPDAPAPAHAEAAFKFPGGLCKILCDVAAAAGHLACGKLPGPAQALCNAGVDAGATLCKSKCK